MARGPFVGELMTSNDDARLCDAGWPACLIEVDEFVGACRQLEAGVHGDGHVDLQCTGVRAGCEQARGLDACQLGKPLILEAAGIRTLVKIRRLLIAIDLECSSTFIASTLPWTNLSEHSD